MFDRLLATAMSAVRGLAVGAWARVENAACARRLSAIADVLDARFSEDGSTDRDQWCMDNWNAVACEVAAHHGVSLGVASHQLTVAMALRERLPRVAEVFDTGRISYRLVNAIVYRTALIADPQARAKVDVELAAAVADWGVLSEAAVEQNIDYWVERHDGYALRRTENRARGRHADVSAPDGRGTRTLEAELLEHDGAAVDARLDAMAHGVCDNDPRTLDQRRSDALGALGHGFDRLACQCESDDCDAAGVQPNALVLNVIANESSLSDDTPAVLDGENPDKPTKPVREMTIAEAAVTPPPTGPAHTAPAVMIGGGVIPAPLLAAKIAAGATIRWIHHPGGAPPQPRYRPSAKLGWFVRCRDMTCRFPGCKKPADICDLDHTIAYPYGPTCASNLKCLCREHHLLKTFWAGPNGWRDEQRADGTVVWTDPHGQTHVTRPGSYGFFPQLCRPTAPVDLSRAQLAAASATGAQPGHALAMPRRKRTRAEDRAARVAAERLLNAADPQAGPLAPQDDDTPPPF